MQQLTGRKLTKTQRRKRSIFKRVLVRPVNSSDAMFIQFVPEFIHNRNIDLQHLRSFWTDGLGARNDADLARLIFLIANLAKVLDKNLPGAFAELGVWRGNSARVLKELAGTRDLFLFDTFCGFEATDAASDPTNVPAGLYASSLEEVQRRVGTEANIHYCVGHFPGTANMVPDGTRFAFVHLDCDLYAPMKAALEFFYPRMVPGGLVMLHDYASGSWPGVAQAVDEFLADRPEDVVVAPDKSGSAAFFKSSAVIP